MSVSLIQCFCQFRHKCPNTSFRASLAGALPSKAKTYTRNRTQRIMTKGFSRSVGKQTVLRRRLEGWFTLSVGCFYLPHRRHLFLFSLLWRPLVPREITRSKVDIRYLLFFKPFMPSAARLCLGFIAQFYSQSPKIDSQL